MNPKLNLDIAKELLSIKSDGVLNHRESQTLEFKESFNFAGLAEYYRDFAAFANNKGGYLIFGVKDRPRRELIGLTKNAIEQLEKLDPEKISGYLLDCFAGNIDWTHEVFQINNMHFGFFYISEATIKPIICKKDDGKDKELKNGEIYYRYGGRTQKIQYAELESIIAHRIEKNNNSWMDLISKIGKAGPQNAAVLDLDKGAIEKNDSKILVVDEKLTKSIQWIREGEFDEKKGAKTLKLVGSVTPIDTVEIIRTEKMNLLKDFPLSADELADEVKKRDARIGKNTVWRIIRENNIKTDKDYSDYNFRSNKQAEEYKKTGKLPKGVPSLFKSSAVDLIIRIFNNEQNGL